MMRTVQKSKQLLFNYILKLLSWVSEKPAGQIWLHQHVPYLQDLLTNSFCETGKLHPNPYKEQTEQFYARIGILQRQDIVFITGRFRSGSTLLWNIFRALPGFTSYYEPFNERRWFDQYARGQDTDQTHRGVSEYWREYDGLEQLEQYFSEAWNNRRLFMTRHSWDNNMINYIDTLIKEAPGRPILQFNRIDFRLTWLRQHYPKAKIIHIYRNPRDQWLSIIKQPENCPPDTSFAELGTRDFFYFRSWGRDLSTIFPYLSESRLKHPYELFYLIWRLSYNYGKSYADYSIRFEDLLNNPAGCLQSMFIELNIDESHIEAAVRKIQATPCHKWKTYASGTWFDQYEAVCEELLKTYYKSAP